MPIHKFTPDAFVPLEATTFAAADVLEAHLQRLLRADVSVVAEGVLVIAEEFADWTGSDRRIDLLGVDREANLVVIELKRDDRGGHMELQAIRYAAMVSNLTFARAVDAYQAFLGPDGGSARDKLLAFLGWDEPREDAFAGDVRIVLVAADFSKEVTTAVLWLNERDLDVRCVRVRPYRLGADLLVDVQQVVPLPEASDYQIGVREKAIVRRESARQRTGEPTGFWFMNNGDDGQTPNRDWEDCRRYGFMTAGGGPRYRDQVAKLQPGHRFSAYASGHGYVGYGEVIAAAVPQRAFVPPGQSERLVDLPTVATPKRQALADDERCEWCVAVRWFQTRPKSAGVHRIMPNLGTVSRIKRAAVVTALLATFAPAEAASPGPAAV